MRDRLGGSVVAEAVVNRGSAAVDLVAAWGVGELVMGRDRRTGRWSAGEVDQSWLSVELLPPTRPSARCPRPSRVHAGVRSSVVRFRGLLCLETLYGGQLVCGSARIGRSLGPRFGPRVG